jgi:hypothetical protein
MKIDPAKVRSSPDHAMGRPPQPIGETAHHLEREIRRLGNQELKCLASTGTSRPSVFAMAVALRGEASISAISPMIPPADAVSDDLVVVTNVDLAVANDVHKIAWLALLEDGGARCDILRAVRGKQIADSCGPE